jgi:sulfate/thiosulfate transport system substrate-binding protein
MRRLRSFSGAPVTLAATLATGALFAGCGGSSDTSSSASGSSSAAGGGSGAKLSLVAYSTPKKAYDALTTAFAQTPAGNGVSFSQSFGASGSQSRAVDSGQPADIVAFSTTPDLTRLVTSKIVSSSWNANPQKGISSNSVVVFVTRKGNPKHIAGWDDLVKPGVDVITPNPSTSGSARWNILAGYGAQLKEGKSPAQALAYVKTLLTKHVSVQDSSASAALHTFGGGKGDVLLDYESDAIAAKKADPNLQYIVPKQTILIETPIAVTTRSSHQAQAKAFVSWQWTPAGQTIWAKRGYRPVRKAVLNKYSAQFPTPPQLFNIKFLGGWTKVKTTFFDPANGSITQIEKAAGVPTASS